jgi:hypothetical protein
MQVNDFNQFRDVGNNDHNPILEHFHHTQEAEKGKLGVPCQTGVQGKLKASLGYVARPCLQKKKKKT